MTSPFASGAPDGMFKITPRRRSPHLFVDSFLSLIQFLLQNPNAAPLTTGHPHPRRDTWTASPTRENDDAMLWGSHSCLSPSLTSEDRATTGRRKKDLRRCARHPHRRSHLRFPATGVLAAVAAVLRHLQPPPVLLQIPLLKQVGCKLKRSD
ncbi:hypothetical protein PIB30_077038 [Stylosanthes scabra]|uniref:Uncharacterized protein n=1 Tax=Stylosanthes scabra TaxID=79078 RepID=A0ABU6QQK7_9FABA|nr:hypothetical protein [Stylosanthes scabra]